MSSRKQHAPEFKAKVALEVYLLPAGPSFITRVCKLEFGIRAPGRTQARRARRPHIAQALGALVAGSG